MSDLKGTAVVVGFMVMRDGQPCRMDLDSDLQGGNTFRSPISIFDTFDEAEEAANAHAQSMVDAGTYSVSEVKINVYPGSLVSMSEDDDEDDDEY